MTGEYLTIREILDDREAWPSDASCEECGCALGIDDRYFQPGDEVYLLGPLMCSSVCSARHRERDKLVSSCDREPMSFEKPCVPDSLQRQTSSLATGE